MAVAKPVTKSALIRALFETEGSDPGLKRWAAANAVASTYFSDLMYAMRSRASASATW
jgi:hypothetical protein